MTGDGQDVAPHVPLPVAAPERDERADVFALTAGQLAAHCRELDLPDYVADQVLQWVYRRGVVDPAGMTNISRANREKLAATLVFGRSRTLARQDASDGTQKLLLGWPDGGEAECVMIPTSGRRTACVSSQVGCPVGCRFCASGLGGLAGNLTAGQIVEQVFRLGRLDPAERISHVVFMGMGEPLANFAAVTDAIRILHAPWGFGIGARRITISTVGLPAAIRKLVSFELPVTLALSVHAPNDEIRRHLIPWAQYATIAELLEACQEYFASTGREITLEYILIREVNDRPDHARELAELAARMRATVNLIRYNEVKGLSFDRPTTADVRVFQEVLRTRGVRASIRASRGRDIAAACGQLRRSQKPGARSQEPAGKAGGIRDRVSADA